MLAFNFTSEEGFDGEVIIAPEIAAREAEEKNLPLKLVIDKLLIHGILHVAGFNHKKPSEAEQMFSMEGQLLKKYLQSASEAL